MYLHFLQMTRFKLKVNPLSADKKAHQNALARERMKNYGEIERWCPLWST